MADAQPPKPPSAVGLMVLGSEMAGFTVVGVIIDLALGTMPGFTIGLTVAGFAFVFFHLVRLSRALSKRSGPPSAGGEG